jgi:hypothetical protein
MDPTSAGPAHPAHPARPGRGTPPPRPAVATRRVGNRARARAADDRGEGVVSAAIVVLIMAALGALMWVGFRTMWDDIERDTNERISEVGS